MVKEASVPSTRETFQEDQNLPSMGNVGMKCPKCKEILLVRDWEKNLKVCSRCNYHFRLSAQERITLLVDAGSFVEEDVDIVPVPDVADVGLQGGVVERDHLVEAGEGVRPGGGGHRQTGRSRGGRASGVRAA